MPPFRECMKFIPSLKDYKADQMTSVFQAAEGFLTKLRLLKIESCCIEGFRLLKQPESIKRVVRREWADVTSTKVPQKDVLPQLVDEVKKLLGQK